MPLLRFGELSEGMVLAVPATDVAGNVVLPAGSVIDKAALNRLRQARIGGVNVVETGRGQAPQGDAKQQGVLLPPDTVVVQARLMKLARMFNEYREDPMMRELCRLAIKCAQERLISV